MLEMWGYSIACAKHGVRHSLMDTLQIEPSSQFGTWTRDDEGRPKFYILHYTFGHQFSLEGVRPRLPSRSLRTLLLRGLQCTQSCPWITQRRYTAACPCVHHYPPLSSLAPCAQVPMHDSKSGEWALDKREHQRYLSLALPPPPHCALEASWTLWRLLHDGMVGTAGWPTEAHKTSDPKVTSHASYVRPRVEALATHSGALELLGSGPWQLAGVGGGEIFFLRGGFMLTPWGSARWGSALPGDADLPSLDGRAPRELVVYLCGPEWTHSITLPQQPLRGRRGGADGGSERGRVDGGSDRPLQLRLTERRGSSSTAQLATLVPKAAAALYASDSEEGEADAATALVGRCNGTREDAAALRRRLVGTGPYRLAGVGALYLLRGGVAYEGHGKAWGSWRTLEGTPGHSDDPGGARADRAPTERSPLLELELPTGAPLLLSVACWRLSVVSAGGNTDAARHSAWLVWPRPVQRCFSSCGDSTRPLTAADLRASSLARRVMQWAVPRQRDSHPPPRSPSGLD